jgi:hypothetical protein
MLVVWLLFQPYTKEEEKLELPDIPIQHLNNIIAKSHLY